MGSPHLNHGNKGTLATALTGKAEKSALRQGFTRWKEVDLKGCCGGRPKHENKKTKKSKRAEEKRKENARGLGSRERASLVEG